MPAAHNISKYFFATLSLSGDNRLGAVLTGGPVVLMKHSTLCFVVQDAYAVFVISRNSSSSRANREEWTTLTPEILLEVDENRVAVPECSKHLSHKSIVIL